jgi:hypothetical protein
MPIVINGSGSITGISAGGLPDGCVLDADINGMAASKLTGALPAISGASLTGISAGITMADQWRLTTPFDSSSSDITNNWERVDTGGFGQIGTGMTQSSGIFTFPSTGIYRIDFQAAANRGSNDSIRFVNLYIKTTTDNGSNYSEASYAVTNIHNANNVYGSGYLTHIFDVTDVSTHKVKFTVQSENTLQWVGSTNSTQTGVAFTRLGDT